MAFLYNLLPILTLGLCIWVCLLLKKRPNNIILKIFCITLVTLKIFQYIWRNTHGNFSLPVEISSISYFLVPIVLIFNIKSLKSVASFFGVFAGGIYFAGYVFTGFLFATKVSLFSLIFACFSHGIMLICGVSLFVQNKFENKEEPKIWITILAMICWALVFYNFNIGGTTFIYYVITPEFLLLSEHQIINAITYVIYYSLVVFTFLLTVKCFQKINHLYSERKIKK